MIKRSKNFVVCGVIAGICEYINKEKGYNFIDPFFGRLLYASLALAVGVIPFLIIYIILVMIMPFDDDKTN